MNGNKREEQVKFAFESQQICLALERYNWHLNVQPVEFFIQNGDLFSIKYTSFQLIITKKISCKQNKVSKLQRQNLFVQRDLENGVSSN